MAAAGLAASGLDSFRSERYQEAVRDFTAAIEVEKSSSGLAKLLDCRAACYERLQMPKSALEDVKEEMQLRPDLAKGYLRASRIYESIGKLNAALNIIEAGVRRVAKPDAIFNQRAKELREKLEKNASPLGNLPEELFVHTMAYLDSQQRFKCTHVCRTWRHAIHTRPSLWRDLHLGEHLTIMRAKSKISYWRDRLHGLSLKSLVVSLNFKQRTLMSDAIEVFSALEPIATSLEEMTLINPSSGHASHHDLQCEQILIRRLGTLLGLTPRLRSLELRIYHLLELPNSLADFANGFGPLERLVMLDRAGLRTQHWLLLAGEPLATPTGRSLSTLCPLRYLCMGSSVTHPEFDFWLYEWPFLEHLDLTGSMVKVPPMETLLPTEVPSSKYLDRRPVLPRLRTMMLRADRSDPYSHFHVLFSIAPMLCRLSYTEFSDNPDKRRVWEHLSVHSPMLEEMDISKCVLERDGMLFSSLAWPNLRRLDISGTSFEDPAITQLATAAPNLEVLIAKSVFALTGGPLMRLVGARQGCFKELNVDDCQRISLEAIEWLRKVVIKFSARMRTGPEKTWTGKFT